MRVWKRCFVIYSGLIISAGRPVGLSAHAIIGCFPIKHLVPEWREMPTATTTDSNEKINLIFLENTTVDFYFYFPLNAAVNSSFSSTLLLLPRFEIMFANFQAAWKKCFLLPLRGLVKTQIHQTLGAWSTKCQQRLTPACHRKYLRNST